VGRQGTSHLVGSDADKCFSPPEYPKAFSHTKLATIPGEMAARQLASSWCSAYLSSSPEQLAALETGDVEIVDRFGGWHHLTGLAAREQFWKDGFDMTSRTDFRPKCTVQHVRLLGRNAAIVQVKISYDGGIAMQDGDRIPPFSEIHTLLVVKEEDTLLISAEDIVQQNSWRKEKQVFGESSGGDDRPFEGDVPTG
jgi:hypothetical protein